MLDRIEPWFKALFLLAAALLLFQFARLAGGNDPLANVTFPSTFAASNSSPDPQAPATNSPSHNPLMNHPPDAMIARPGGAPEFNPAAGPPRPGAPPRQPDLPPAVQKRVDRVRDSEVFAPIQRPLPMALIALGGNEALIRAPNGQTNWLKEGDELGGVRLLRIGINRVLIEHEGQQKELMIFAGFGGESLLKK